MQTEQYANEIHIAGPYTTSPAYVRRWVEARMERQRRLTDAEPLRFHAIIAEAALRLEVGGPSVMVEQLDKLIDVGELPHVMIQVLPFQAGAHPNVSGSLTVLNFADPKLDPPMAYFDVPVGGFMVNDEGQVAIMSRMHADLHALALSASDSRDMIGTIRAGYHAREVADV